MPLVLTKPFRTSAGQTARLLASNLRGRQPLLFAVDAPGADEVVYQTDLEGRLAGSRTPFIINTPDSGWCNLYRRADGSLYIGQPKATREEAVAGLERNARDTNITYIKTIEVTA